MEGVENDMGLVDPEDVSTTTLAKMYGNENIEQ